MNYNVIRRIRPDLLICMLLAMLVYYILYVLCGRLDVTEKLDRLFDSFSEKDVTEVSDGVVGGYALDETPRVTNQEELIKYSNNFTLEMSYFDYVNFGINIGEEYEWHLFKLPDNTMIVARVNNTKVQTIQNKVLILPVGKIINKRPEIMDKIEERYADDYIIMSNAYIDMDGIANYTKISSFKKIINELVPWMVILIPLVFFALFIGLVLAIHTIFYKLGIFPSIYENKGKSNISN